MIIETLEDDAAVSLVCGDKTLDLSHPHVMGVLNVTPDSFSDGGRYLDRDAALERAGVMVAEGASIIDIGGESTRPGAVPVPVEEELQRVIPVVEAVHAAYPVVISVDTSRPEVMAAAAAAGAGMINDVRALRVEGAPEAAVRARIPVCLMHMQGEPPTMQERPRYGDVVREVTEDLGRRIDAATAAGIPRSRLLVDPGFGFGKTVAHNMALLRHLESLQSLALPLVVGLSRKSMIGKLLGAAPQRREYGGVAVAVMAVMKGAVVVRAHDVRSTLEAITICHRVLHDDLGDARE